MRVLHCMFGPCFVIQCFVYVYFCNYLMGNRAGCFAFKLTVSLMSSDNKCSVALDLRCVTVVFPDRTHLLFQNI